MRCPACNAATTTEAIDGGAVVYCDACGWGRDRAEAAKRGGLDASPSAKKPNPVLVVFALLFTVGLVVGPYVALLVYVADPPMWVHLTYGLAMVSYLLIAATTTPRYDTSNLGWAGGLVDNPFSFEDDANRWALGFAVFLLPGKVAVWSVRASLAWVR